MFKFVKVLILSTFYDTFLAFHDIWVGEEKNKKWQNVARESRWKETQWLTTLKFPKAFDIRRSLPRDSKASSVHTGEVQALRSGSRQAPPDNIPHPSVCEERCIATPRKGWQAPQVNEEEVDLPGGNPGGLLWSACILMATLGQIKSQRNTPVIPGGTAEYVWKVRRREGGSISDITETRASEAFISL